MQIVARYPFNGGIEAINREYPHLLTELEECISSIDASEHRTKESEEKTMLGKMLYSPASLNKAFKKFLLPLDWEVHRENCEYTTEFYIEGYEPEVDVNDSRAYREMDFVKERLGVEVQFGKYAFMVYNVCAKMTIFHNLDLIDLGVEIVPVKSFANEMSTGVSYFEQFIWDLEQRGVSDIDIPVLVIGIDID